MGAFISNFQSTIARAAWQAFTDRKLIWLPLEDHAAL